MELKLDDTYLLTPAEEFDFKNPPMDPIELSKALVKTMIDQRGLGLAANQCGVPYRVFAMFTQPENTVMFNPRIVDVSNEMIELDEGCLSYPEMLIKVKRPRHIKVRFVRPNGETVTEKYTGMTARCIQHEMDHLNGKPFWHDVSRLQFERIRKRCLADGAILYSGMRLRERPSHEKSAVH